MMIRTGQSGLRAASPCGLLLRAVMALAFMAFAATASAQATKWYTNWPEAQRAMAEQKKPAMVYFYNYQARPCHEMQITTFDSKDVKDRMQSFVCVALLEPDNREMFKGFRLFKVPSVVFVDWQGRELDRAVGFKPPASYIQYLDRITNTAKSGGGSASAGAAGVSTFKQSAVNVLVPSQATSPVKLSFFAPDAKSVNVVADFNDWREDSLPMTKAASGEWSVTVHLPEGVYEYIYKVDGETWKPDPKNPLRRPNPYGGINSIIKLGNPKVSPMINGRSVLFILYDAQATKIEVAGSFTGWAPVPMFRNPKEPGMWGVKYDLPAGTHTYKYIIDDVWVPDPENYTPEYDGSQNWNSSFTLK